MKRKLVNNITAIAFAICAIFTCGRASGLTVEPPVLYVEEDWPLNTTLDVQICSAKFAASALAGQSEIRIVSGNIGGKFQLAYEGGKCATLKLMKRVIEGQSFVLDLEDENDKRKALLRVEIIDVNDNAPQFLNIPAQIFVDENTPVGSVVYRLFVYDRDIGLSGQSAFSVVGRVRKFNVFEAQCNQTSHCSAEVRLVTPLQRNRVEFVEFVVRDGGGATKISNEVHGSLSVIVTASSSSIVTASVEMTTTPSEPTRTSVVRIDGAEHQSVYGFVEAVNNTYELYSTGKEATGYEGVVVEVSMLSTFTNGMSSDYRIMFLTHFDGPLTIQRNLRLSTKVVKISAQLVHVENNEVEEREAKLDYAIRDNAYFEIDATNGWISLKRSLFDLGNDDVSISLVVTVSYTNLSIGTVFNELEFQILVADGRRTRPICMSHHYTGQYNKMSQNFLLNERIKVYDENGDSAFRLSLSGKYSSAFILTPTEVRGIADVVIILAEPGVLQSVREPSLKFQIEIWSDNTTITPTSTCYLTVSVFNSADALIPSSYISPHSFTERMPLSTVATTTVASDAGSSADTGIIGYSGEEMVVGKHVEKPILQSENKYDDESPLLFPMSTVDPEYPSYMTLAILSTVSDEDAQEISSATITLTSPTTESGRHGTTAFAPWHYDVEVLENTPVGTEILRLNPYPKSLWDDNGYENEAEELLLLESGDDRRHIKLCDNGTVVVAYELDFERLKSSEINASVRTLNGATPLAIIRVKVIDRNDMTPIFRIQNGHKVLLSEAVNVGHLLNLPYPLASDNDSTPQYSTLQYSLGNYRDFFEIDPLTSEIRVRQSLADDFSSSPEVCLRVRAVDNLKRFGEVGLTIEKAQKSPLDERRNEVEVTLTLVILRSAKSALARLVNAYPSIIELNRHLAAGTLIYESKRQLPKEFRLYLKSLAKMPRLVEVENGVNLRLVGSLAGYPSDQFCVDLVVESLSSSDHEKFVPKPICFVIRPTYVESSATTALTPPSVSNIPLATIAAPTLTEGEAHLLSPQIGEALTIEWPKARSVHVFKENVDYSEGGLMKISPKLSSDSLLDKYDLLEFRLLQTMSSNDFNEFEIDEHGVLRARALFDFEEKSSYSLALQACLLVSGTRNATSALTTPAAVSLGSDGSAECSSVVEFRLIVEDANDNCPYFPQNDDLDVFEKADRYDGSGAEVLQVETIVRRLNRSAEVSALPNKSVNDELIYIGDFEPAIDGDRTPSICYELLPADNQQQALPLNEEREPIVFLLPDRHQPRLYARKKAFPVFGGGMGRSFNIIISANDCGVSGSSGIEFCNGTLSAMTASRQNETSAEDITHLSLFSVNSRKRLQIVVERSGRDYNDSNARSPKFFRPQYFATVTKASAKIGDTILRVEALDGDLGDNVKYRMKFHNNYTSPPPFWLNSTSGEIALNATFANSVNVADSYLFHVIARDRMGREDECEVSILLTDIEHRVELTFTRNAMFLEKSLSKLERLLSDLTSLTAFSDELIAFPANASATVVVHFLDKHQRAVPMAVVVKLIQKNRSRIAESAYTELVSRYGWHPNELIPGPSKLTLSNNEYSTDEYLPFVTPSLLLNDEEQLVEDSDFRDNDSGLFDMGLFEIKLKDLNVNDNVAMPSVKIVHKVGGEEEVLIENHENDGQGARFDFNSFATGFLQRLPDGLGGGDTQWLILGGSLIVILLSACFVIALCYYYNTRRSAEMDQCSTSTASGVINPFSRHQTPPFSHHKGYNRQWSYSSDPYYIQDEHYFRKAPARDERVIPSRNDKLAYNIVKKKERKREPLTNLRVEREGPVDCYIPDDYSVPQRRYNPQHH